MHVGMAAVFQNPGKARSDRDVYVNELRLAELAEPLGFESVWGVEHHFTDYTMCPDVLQFLSYMAGRTQRAQLGSMVVVLRGTIRCGWPRKCPCSATSRAAA
jgi:alkanesulfonate monooxygenase SsuD/methylene tetrahydromethanopterin reductase-like flavin-dependent oxidoreductase (luciferase family)